MADEHYAIVNTGLHPDQDADCQRAPGLLSAPRRGIRRASWSGIGGPGRGARAQPGPRRRGRENYAIRLA